MKLRLLAMATVAAAALSTPAMAGEGWYLGLGGGYDNQKSFSATSVPRVPTFSPSVNAKDSAIGAIAIGYAWSDTGWRLENEFAFTQHDISASGPAIGGVTYTATGGNQISSDMINLLYDIPLGDTWKITLGGGVGIGGYRGSLRTTGTSFDIFRGAHSAFQWQAIGGLAVSIAPDVDLFAEYRYRENETDGNFGSSYTILTPIHVSTISENVAMLGLRWFMTPPAPPAPRRLRLRLPRRLPRRRRRRRTSSSSTLISRTSPRKRRARLPRLCPLPRLWALSGSWSPATPTRSARIATTRRSRSAAPPP
jgi:opacity protein-like surface antigen